jgi:hypothetical protein
MGGSESREDISQYDYVKNADKSLYGEARLCKKEGSKKQVILNDRFCEDTKVTMGFQTYLSQPNWKS